MAVVNTGLPVVSDTTPTQGQVINTTNGTWTFDEDYLTYTYRWMRCDAGGASCVAIPGAIGSGYQVQAADVGFTVRAEVDATQHTGSPPAGNLYTQISDFDPPDLLNPGAGNYRITEVSTIHGPGFRFIVDFAGGSGNGVQIIDGVPTTPTTSGSLFDANNYLGVTLDLSGWVMFPSAGNTSGSSGTGFPDYWDWNALWEFGPGFTWNNQWGVVGPTRQIYVRSYKAGAQDSRRKAVGPAFDLDTWYEWRWVVKSSNGADGLVQFYWNGTDITGGAWTGPTQPSSNPAPWMQLGFYSGGSTHNEVYYANVTKN